LDVARPNVAEGATLMLQCANDPSAFKRKASQFSGRAPHFL
jgi:hypothetical protein